MQKFIISAIVLFSFVFVAQAQSISLENIKANVLEYGNVQQNSDGIKTITVKNTGKAPLVISSVKSSCGCTVPSFEKKPILPGKFGEIKVQYKTQRVGAINKTITIISNDVKNPTKLVRLRGKVLPGNS